MREYVSSVNAIHIPTLVVLISMYLLVWISVNVQKTIYIHSHLKIAEDYSVYGRSLVTSLRRSLLYSQSAN